MADREFLDPSISANTLAGGCRGLTRLQRTDYLRPYLGKWLKIGGQVLVASDNRPLAGFGVTVVVPDPVYQIDVFCSFYSDEDRLALVTSDDEVEVEGVLLHVDEYNMKLDSCVLLDTMDSSEVSNAITRDQYLRSLIASRPEKNGTAPVVEGVRLEDAASALHRSQTAASIVAGLIEVRAKIGTFGLTNFEKASAQSYVNIMIEIAQMPEPDVGIFWLALERLSCIASIAGGIAGVIALFRVAS